MKISKNGLEEMWLTFADRLLKGEMKAQGNQVNFEIDPTVLLSWLIPNSDIRSPSMKKC